MRRTALTLIVGIAVGVAVTVGYVQVAGGWYTYSILTPEECRREHGNTITAEVVPHQPNPCHFRRLRWQLFR